MTLRRLGQQREDGSGYGSEAFGDGASDEETRAEVGLTIGKGRPPSHNLKWDIVEVFTQNCILVLFWGDSKGATFTYVTDFSHIKAATEHGFGPVIV